MYEVYLAHHGILGMKWGIRRYQNKDGSLTAEGKKRYAVDADGNIRKLTSKERKAVSTAQKQRAAALEKARKARAEKAEYNKQKAEAIKSGEASKIEKYFNDLTPNELKEAMERVNTKQNFQRLLNQEAQLVANGKSKTDRLMDKVGKASDWAEKGIRAYNIIAKINNAFNSESYMPQVGGEWAGDRKRKLDKERKEERKKAIEEKKEAKEKKEREKVEKMINTADEYTLYKNRGKLSTDDWKIISMRLKTEEALFDSMKKQKIGAIQARQEAHSAKAQDYVDQGEYILSSSKVRHQNLMDMNFSKEDQERIERAILRSRK